MSSGLGFVVPEWKKFVKSSDVETCLPTTHSTDIASSNEPSHWNRGIDARKSYEEIIGSGEFRLPEETLEDSNKLLNEEVVRARSRSPLKTQDITGDENTDASSLKLKETPPVTFSVPLKEDFRPSLSLLMRYAEQNDCLAVMDVLKHNESLINCVDQFGWSTLMVASCAGADTVVKLLLHSGANLGIRDRRGETCVSLAQKKGHLNIVKIIENVSSVKSKSCVPPVHRTVSKEQTQLCSSCNTRIAESQEKAHLTSTIHLLNKCPHGCRTYYSIPGSNRGYQLMLKDGWDGEKGLGPSGNGMKLPPKTILKRDRKGLGASKDRARITHFKSNDYNAISSKQLRSENSRRPQNKYHLRQQIQHDKLIERSLRWEMN